MLRRHGRLFNNLIVVWGSREFEFPSLHYLQSISIQSNSLINEALLSLDVSQVVERVCMFRFHQ